MERAGGRETEGGRDSPRNLDKEGERGRVRPRKGESRERERRWGETLKQTGRERRIVRQAEVKREKEGEGERGERVSEEDKQCEITRARRGLLFRRRRPWWCVYSAGRLVSPPRHAVMDAASPRHTLALLPQHDASHPAFPLYATPPYFHLSHPASTPPSLPVGGGVTD